MPLVRIEEIATVKTTAGRISYHCELDRLSNLISDIVFRDVSDSQHPRLGKPSVDPSGV